MEKKEIKPEDSSGIDIHEPWVVAYWTKKLDCSVAMLRQAVAEVGPLVKDVKRKIKEMKDK